MAKKRSGKGKQTNIEGTEPKVHKDIRRSAETYVEARDERLEWGKSEKERKTKLVEVMKKHGLEEYVDPAAEIRVLLELGEDGVKVKPYDPEASTPPADPDAPAPAND